MSFRHVGFLSADFIKAGTFGEEIIIGAAGGIIRSADYDPGVAGWQIDGDGNAEFNDVTVRGTLIAGDESGQHVKIDPAGVSASAPPGAAPGGIQTFGSSSGDEGRPAELVSEHDPSVGDGIFFRINGPRHDQATGNFVMGLSMQSGGGNPHPDNLSLGGPAGQSLDLDDLGAVRVVGGPLEVFGQFAVLGGNIGVKVRYATGTVSGAGNINFAHGSGFTAVIPISAWVLRPGGGVIDECELQWVDATNIRATTSSGNAGRPARCAYLVLSTSIW